MADLQELVSLAEREFFRLLQTDLYAQRLGDLVSRPSGRLALSLDDLRSVNPTLPSALLRHPLPVLAGLEQVLQDAARDLAGIKKQGGVYHVTVEGNFGSHYVTPRGLRAGLANQLVKVQGIISRMSLVRPKLLKSVHYCEATGTGHVKVYGGEGDRSTTIPLRDAEGNPMSMEFGLSTYKDTQTLLLQEFPEKIPTGQLPRTIEVLLEQDLVDAARPGDRAEIVGVYRTIANAQTAATGTFRSIVQAFSLSTMQTEAENLELSGQDVREIRAIAGLPDTLAVLGASLAPSIYGHEEIKQALVLLALGGCERNLANGTHLRGDVNILLVGDPSTAKSQLLRTMRATVPLCSCTTGRGSSGVGLTAAVVLDKDTGERHLAAGAMVLADRGVICIDEFDKMEEMDRVAIHEVMEQQTVTIAKAGVHASLNARCSVLAAANPIYGTYAPDLPPAKNIALPDSLLSRFDLLFIVLDAKSSELDRCIAERVLRNHTTGSVLLEHFDSGTEVLEERLADEQEHKAWYRSDGRELIHRDLLKKFLHYARSRVKPELSPEASAILTTTWTDLRSRDDSRKLLPITVRSLETLIRLSTACAKAKLSTRVEVSHCLQAIALLKFAILHEEEPALAVGQAVDLVARLQLKRRREEDSSGLSQLLRAPKASSSPAGLEAKRQVFLTLVRMSEEAEMPQANINTLLVELQREDSTHWSKELMIQALKTLEQEGKLLLQEGLQTATLI